MQRVFRKRFFFHAGNVVVHAVCQRQNGRNAHNANGSCNGGHDGAAFFCHQVVEGKGKRCKQAHGRAARLLRAHARKLGGGGLVGVGVAYDNAVGQVHDARGILFGQLRVVRDHDHQAVLGNFGEQVHDLHACLGVKRAGWFVGQKNFGVVDECARNSNALHLTAGKLVRTLVNVFAQSNALQCFRGAFFTFIC